MQKLAFSLLFLSTLAFGLAETDLAQDYSRLVTPLFSLGTPGTFTGQRDIPLQYRAFPRKEGKGVIVIVPGYTESFLKYQELIYDLWNAGFGVYIFDHRGMGLSGRMLKNPQIVHVEKFQYYVDDLAKFVDEVVLRDPLSSKLYVIGHSLGGLVSAHLMALRPQLFRAGLLSAPLLDMNTGKYARPVAVALSNALVLIGRGNEYAPGFKDFNLNEFQLENSPVTQSQMRFDLFKDTLAKFPKIQMGGPDASWVKLLLKETEGKRIETLGGKVRTPILMFQPTIDGYANPLGMNRFCGAAWECRKMVIAGGKHETFREKDAYRAPALKATLDFFESH